MISLNRAQMKTGSTHGDKPRSKDNAPEGKSDLLNN
jgi:hypothetical protein